MLWLILTGHLVEAGIKQIIPGFKEIVNNPLYLYSKWLVSSPATFLSPSPKFFQQRRSHKYRIFLKKY